MPPAAVAFDYHFKKRHMCQLAEIDQRYVINEKQCENKRALRLENDKLLFLARRR